MPVYNTELYIAEAIDSVLAQTYRNFELIIINDGSTDSTLSIISSYNDNRIKLINNEGNKGLIYSLNYGFSIAKGAYIARMDSDDICFPDRFEKQIGFLEKYKNISILGTAYKVIGSNDVFYYPANPEQARIKLLEDTPFAHPTIMIRKKDVIANNLLYNHDYKHVEDYRFFVDVAMLNLKMANLNDILLKYRVHESQISTSKRDEQAINAKKVRIEYLDFIFGKDSFTEDELFYIENKFENASFQNSFEILNKLRIMNIDKNLFSPVYFEEFMRNTIKRISIKISKNDLLNVLKTKIPVMFKYYVLKHYCLKVLKNI